LKKNSKELSRPYVTWRYIGDCHAGAKVGKRATWTCGGCEDKKDGI
jgi:hypothetical protein